MSDVARSTVIAVLFVASDTDSTTPEARRGRPGLLPPLGVSFDDALSALLKTPPPPKGEAADKPKGKGARRGKRRV